MTIEPTAVDPLGPGASSLSAPRQPPPPDAWGDWLGMAASIGCAVHCAAMPFVIAYLPALGLSFLADAAFHKWMAVACFLIALVAFVPGFRQHRRWTPVALGSVGLVLISVAAFGFAGECCPSCEDSQPPPACAGATGCTDPACPHAVPESPAAPATSPATASHTPPGAIRAAPPWVGRLAPWLTPLGGLVLVSAHLLNRHHGRPCGCCGGDPPP